MSPGCCGLTAGHPHMPGPFQKEFPPPAEEAGHGFRERPAAVPPEPFAGFPFLLVLEGSVDGNRHKNVRRPDGYRSQTGHRRRRPQSPEPECTGRRDRLRDVRRSRTHPPDNCFSMRHMAAGGGGEAGPFAETAAAGAGPAAYRRRARPSRAVRINSGISSGSGRRRLCPVRRRGTRSLGAKAFLGAKPFQGRTGRTLPRLHRDPFRTLPKKGGRLPGPRLHPAKAGGSALLPFARNPV